MVSKMLVGPWKFCTRMDGTSNIEYYNRILKEFRVNFSVGSVDYISPDEIGDPELYFVW